MVAMKKSTLCMADVLKEYDRLREGLVSSSAFWDVVVLTTSDAEQQQVYQLEIANKLEQKELPTCATYHVVHDPPGAKIGTGGSTMYTLSRLTQLEPEWKTQKILLMHAGGSSQRLPSASVLGKAFTTIPIGDRIYTMFDVKLALCMPFAEKLPAGVFICCPDTFETFTFGNGSDWDFANKRGFLALAHPSPMQIGTGHGVYVLSDRNHKLDTEVLACSKVLQKPTERMMREEGAVLRSSEIADNMRSAGAGTGTAAGEQEWVFTDSNYFFDHSISDKLLSFYEENKPLTGEICAYGDFLQPLGSSADDSYINNCKNIMTMSPGLLSTRRQVYELLKGSPLSVIALKQSKFYHIGTLTEYIENFCSNDSLREELGLSKFCYSAYVNPSTTYSTQSADNGGCVVHSLITPSCSFSSCSVVEYCKFTADVTVQGNCVISNCEYTGNGNVHPHPLLIPENTFMQTVPVLDPSGLPKFVTLIFSIHDDMKSKASCLSDVSNISYFDRSLITVREPTVSDHTDLFGKGNPYTLWNAKLFPLSHTSQSSFLLALTTLQDLFTHKKRSIGDATCDQPCFPNGTCANNNGITHFTNGGVSGCHRYSTETDTNGTDTNGTDTNGTDTSHRFPSKTDTNGVKSLYSNGKNHSGHATLYSFADVIKHKDTKRMIKGRNELSALIKSALSASTSRQSMK